MGGNLKDLEDLPRLLFHSSLSYCSPYFTFGFLPPFLLIPSQPFPAEAPGALIHFWFSITSGLNPISVLQ